MTGEAVAADELYGSQIAIDAGRPSLDSLAGYWLLTGKTGLRFAQPASAKGRETIR